MEGEYYYSRNHNQKKYTQYRKKLRKFSTKSERILWWKIKNKQLGVKFRRQFGIGRYSVDFYCCKHKLIIELDGYTHISQELIEHDKQRDQYLQSLGNTILRFRDEEVLKETERVLHRISICVDPTLPPIESG